MSYKSPLGQARGMGSAKSGSHHFYIQRVTGIALVPLVLWFTYAVACLANGGVTLAEAQAFVANPCNATLLICLVIATFYHSALGVQVVLEDYVRPHALALTIRMLFNFACFALAVVSILSVLKVAVAH